MAALMLEPDSFAYIYEQSLSHSIHTHIDTIYNIVNSKCKNKYCLHHTFKNFTWKYQKSCPKNKFTKFFKQFPKVTHLQVITSQSYQHKTKIYILNYLYPNFWSYTCYIGYVATWQSQLLVQGV